MDSQHFLKTAVVFLLATVIAVPLTKRFRLGSVLGYLLAGMVIGPQVLGLISDTEGVATISEFGVVLMLFVIAFGALTVAPSLTELRNITESDPFLFLHLHLGLEPRAVFLHRGAGLHDSAAGDWPRLRLGERRV